MIYLDHNATSPMLDEVREAVLPWLGVPANPASVHRAGQQAAIALEQARVQVAACLGRAPSGVVFTSGATEANHAWFHGIVASGVRSVAVGALEHPCVLSGAERARARGVEVHVLASARDGRVRIELPEGVEAVSLMAANHETGVVQPISELLARGLRVHVDATQAVGRLPLQLEKADAVVFSGHKIGGPGGIGVLSLRGDLPFPALLGGGSQERGRRAGTVHVAAAVGLAVACEVAMRDLSARVERWTRQREVLEAGLRALGGRIVGADVQRVPQTTCVVFSEVPSELLVQALDLRGIAVSAGAACASGSTEPSPVLVAMGDPGASSSIRISQGPDTCPVDLESVLEALAEIVPALSGLD